MYKIILSFLLLLYSSLSFAQQNQDRILYIVDHVAILEDPDEDEQMANEDVETLEVITNLDKIKQLGYEGKFDKIFFIITKEYTARTEEVKKIPSTKLMIKTNGQWCLKDTKKPYSGKFIDYYMNGKIQGDGTLNDGIIDGVRTVYYPNGNKRYFYTYDKGIEHGESEEYFINGKLRQKGSFDHKKEIGIWQNYYSTGKLKRQFNFLNKKEDLPKEELKFHELLSKGFNLLKEEDYAGSVKKFDEAIKLNPDYSDVYFYRGTAKLNLFDFDNSISDLDKAIELEPLYMEAISNRAFARLRKYEFKDSRTLTKTKEVSILATKDNVQIPKEELDKICADLKLGYKLGDRKPMIIDAMNKYCK